MPLQGCSLGISGAPSLEVRAYLVSFNSRPQKHNQTLLEMFSKSSSCASGGTRKGPIVDLGDGCE